MRYVSEESHRKAREMERRFAELAPQAGVLFISVQPDPTEDGKVTDYHIRLGIARRFEEDVGRVLVRKVLEEEIKAGVKIFVGVYRGISCACRDDGTSTAHSLAS